MKQKDFIKEILQTDIKRSRQYTFMLSLRSARHLLGCNLENGEYEHKNITEYYFENGLYFSNMFSGLLNALIFLETIGIIFKPKNNKHTSLKNGIARSLSYFSKLSKSEIATIRSLRNSFAHNFGLAIVNDRKKSNLTHKFILSIEKSDKVIALPEQKWTGNFNDKSDKTATKVYVFNLIKVMEEVYQNILSLNEKEEIELAIPKDKLYTCYSILQ